MGSGKLKVRLMSGASVALFCAITVPTAHAQNAEPEGDTATEQDETRSQSGFGNTIVVTAQKREQDAQDVGIAITAYSGEQIEAANFDNAADVIGQVPNAVARRAFPSRGLTTNYFIRGVGQSDFNDGTESSIAVFTDDFYYIQASQADFATFDVERVEILRGPQGTLFGRNATGGAVQSVTKRPDSVYSGKLSVGVGNFNGRTIDGFLNVPLSDTVSVRVSGVYDTHDPTVTNIFEPDGEDQLDQNFSAGRVQLNWAPSDTFEINFKYEYGLTTGNLTSDQGFVAQGTADGDVVILEESAQGFNPTADGTDDPRITNVDGLSFGENQLDHGLITATWDVSDSVTLTSITGFADQDYEVIEDCDGTPFPNCAFNPVTDSLHWSQEFRLNGSNTDFTWTLGAYYLGQDLSSNVVLPILLTDDGPGGDLPTAVVLETDFQLDVTSAALFGQFEYYLSDQLRFTGGLRLNYDRKEFEQIRPIRTIQFAEGTRTFREGLGPNFRDFSGEIGETFLEHVFNAETAALNPNLADDLNVVDDVNIAGTAQIDYIPNDDLLIYASFRRGLKAGGFNNGLISVTQENIDIIPYQQEVLHAFEGGFKWDFAPANAARLNASVFYYDYNDFQATSYIGIGNIISNNDATVSGAEIELQFSPADGWFVSGAAGIIFDTNVEDVVRSAFDPSPGGGAIADVLFIEDRELGGAADFNLNGLIRYEWDMMDGFWGAQVDASYIDERFVDVLNQTALLLPSLTVVNSTLTYEHDTNGLSASLWVRNLFDQQRPQNIIAAPGLAQLGHFNFNATRTYGATLSYEF